MLANASWRQMSGFKSYLQVIDLLSGRAPQPQSDPPKLWCSNRRCA